MRSLIAIALFALAGCGPFWIDPYITVKESPLNWVEIHYYSINRNPIRRIWVRLSGSGFVEVKKGKSDLVSNDFAKRYQDENWGDIKSHRLNVDPAHLNDIFQNLVNYGLLDKEKVYRDRKDGSVTRFLAVKANLCNNTYSEQENIFETDPDLAEELLDVIREFDHQGW